MADHENPQAPEGSSPLDKTVFTPRPGTQSSQPPPTNSNYLPDLPLAEDLQALLGGAYLVESFLGQGGMGAVYKGLQMPLRRPVAIKILQKRQAGAEDDFAFEERFKREAYAMASLTHPHIVQVYDCGDAGESFLFISMELVEGGDLSDAIKGGQITPEVALKLIPQICDGLQAAHDRGLVHRDIKPANIFLTADGRAKVADFGLAKKFDVKSTFVTKTGLGMGTPDYAAPEQYEAVADLDHRADIYALGVMMYQMLTGRLPRGATYKSPSQLAGVDPRIDAVVAKAMATEREDRYQSTAEIKADLAQITAGPRLSQPVPVRGTTTASVPAVGRPATAGRPVVSGQVPQRAGTGAVPVAVPVAIAEPEKRKSGAGLVAIGSIAAVVIGLGAMFVLKKGPAVVDPSGSSSSADPASSQGGGLTSGATWVRPFTSFEEIPASRKSGRAATKDGWIVPDGVTAGVALARATAETPLKNTGVRVRLRYQATPSGPGTVPLGMELRTGPSGNYQFRISSSHVPLLAVHESASGRTSTMEGALSHPPFTPGQEYLVELFAIGQRLVARCNGVLMGSILDSRMSAGNIFARGMVPMRDMEFVDLDGMSEAEALKIAGVDAEGKDAGSGPIQKLVYPQPGAWTRINIKDLKLTSGEVRGDKAVLNAESYAYLPVPPLKNAMVQVKVRARGEIPRGMQIKQRTQSMGVNVYAAVPSQGPPQGLIQIPAQRGGEQRGRQGPCETMAADKDSVFEFIAADEWFTLVIDSRTVVSYRNDSILNAGRIEIFSGRGPIEVSEVVVVSLDGLLEEKYPDSVKDSLAKAKAREAASSGSGVAATSSPGALPPGQWVRRLEGPESLREEQRRPDSGVAWADGIFTVTKSSALYPLGGSPPFRNGGFRATFSRGARYEMRIRNGVKPKEHFYGVTGSRLFYGGVDSATLLSFPSPRTDGGDWHQVEVLAVGNRLIIRRDGALLGVAQHDAIADGGLLLTNVVGRLRDVEVINLDGLPESEALRLAGVDEKVNDLRGKGAAAAPSPGQGTFPPGQWMPVFTKPDGVYLGGDATAKWEEGWIKPGAKAITLMSGPDTLRKNGAQRIRTKWGDPTIPLPRIQARHRKVGNGLSNCLRLQMYSNQQVVLERESVVDGKPARKTLAKSANPLALRPGTEYTLELAVVGNRIMGRVNGGVVVTATHEHQEPGPLAFYYGQHDLRDYEVMNLDGMPEGDALRILGVDAEGNDLRTRTSVATTSPASVPQPDISIPELKVLHEQFVKLKADRVDAPFEADVEKLNAGYVGGLDRAIAEEKKAGHLDGVVAIEAEKKLIADKHALPATDDEKTTEALKKLRAIYRASFAKLDTQRIANLKALTDPLAARLTTLEAELTKNDRVADAKVVREYRKRLDADTGVPDAATAVLPVKPSEMVPAVRSGPDRAQSRAAAQYALEKGAKVYIQRNEQREWVDPANGLPGGSWELDAVIFPSTHVLTDEDLEQVTQAVELKELVVQDPCPAGRFTSYQSLKRLAGLRKLAIIGGPQSPSLGDMEVIKAMTPTLEELYIVFENGAGMAETIGSLAGLKSLVTTFPVSDEDLKQFGKLTELTKLTLNRSHELSDKGLAHLSGLKKLQTLSLPSAENAVTGEGLRSLSSAWGGTLRFMSFGGKESKYNDGILVALADAYPNLEEIILRGAVSPASLAGLQRLGKLISVSVADTPMTVEHLAAIARVENVHTVRLANTKLTDEGVARLADLPKLRSLALSNNPQVTDAALQRLVGCKSLRDLAVESTSVTAAGLRAIQEIKELKVLRVGKGQFSAGELATFKSALPGCQIMGG